jgi:hypothetical protein
MEADERILRMRDEWIALDDAIWATGRVREMLAVWPWESSYPTVQAAWEALTRPEHLADLEFRLACFGGGAGMNDWAAAVTRKAIEDCRQRAAG